MERTTTGTVRFQRKRWTTPDGYERMDEKSEEEITKGNPDDGNENQLEKEEGKKRENEISK